MKLPLLGGDTQSLIPAMRRAAVKPRGLEQGISDAMWPAKAQTVAKDSLRQSSGRSMRSATSDSAMALDSSHAAAARAKLDTGSLAAEAAGALRRSQDLQHIQEFSRDAAMAAPPRPVLESIQSQSIQLNTSRTSDASAGGRISIAMSDADQFLEMDPGAGHACSGDVIHRLNSGFRRKSLSNRQGSLGAPPCRPVILLPVLHLS